MTQEQKIRQKIRSLLYRHKIDTVSQEEGERAFQLAKKLADKYHITLETCDVDIESYHNVYTIEVLCRKKKLGLADLFLLQLLQDFFYVISLVEPAETFNIYSLAGKKEHLIIAKTLYTRFSKLFFHWFKEVHMQPVYKKQDMQAFYMGLYHSIYEKLESLQKRECTQAIELSTQQIKEFLKVRYCIQKEKNNTDQRFIPIHNQYLYHEGVKKGEALDTRLFAHSSYKALPEKA